MGSKEGVKQWLVRHALDRELTMREIAEETSSAEGRYPKECLRCGYINPCSGISCVQCEEDLGDPCNFKERRGRAYMYSPSEY